MRLLLDTHAWLWSLLEPERLAADAAGALADDAHELWLSPISVWEAMVLAEGGRLQLDRPIDAWIQEALQGSPLRHAPLTHEIARVSRRVRLPHEDPADRFIAATAHVHDLTLVTADRRLASCPDVRVLPAA